MTVDLAQARRVKQQHERHLLSLDGVQGVAVGQSDGGPHIKVYVDSDHPSRREAIPRVLEDVPVVVEEAGSFEAL